MWIDTPEQVLDVMVQPTSQPGQRHQTKIFNELGLYNLNQEDCRSQFVRKMKEAFQSEISYVFCNLFVNLKKD